MQHIPLKREKTLDELAFDLEIAKTSLDIAKRELERAEQALLAVVPCELEGSTTTTSNFYKITAVGKLTRTLDVDGLDDLRKLVPEKIFARVIRFKPELSLRDLRYLELNEPNDYSIFAEFITTKPAKTSVKVERIEPITE